MLCQLSINFILRAMLCNDFQDVNNLEKKVGLVFMAMLYLYSRLQNLWPVHLRVDGIKTRDLANVAYASSTILLIFNVTIHI